MIYWVEEGKLEWEEIQKVGGKFCVGFFERNSNSERKIACANCFKKLLVQSITKIAYFCSDFRRKRNVSSRSGFFPVNFGQSNY